MRVAISLRSNERGHKSDLVSGMGGGVLQKFGERWIRGQEEGGEPVCSPRREYSGMVGEARG